MGSANCLAQTNALFRKNLVIQRRNCRANCCLVCFPLLICLLFGGTQLIVLVATLSSRANSPGIDCSNCTASAAKSWIGNKVGGLDCPTECPLPIAPKWPPVLQLPLDSDHEDEDDLGSLESTNNLNDTSTRRAKHSPARFLVTGANRPFAESVMGNMLPKHDDGLKFAADISTLADFVLHMTSQAQTSTNLTWLSRTTHHTRASNAYLQSRGTDTKMQFEFVKDMPRDQSEFTIDISFLAGKVVFVWMIMLLFPVILSNLVYEKQQKLRTIMKMHGLGDMTYWIISYCYFLFLSLLYMLFLVVFGSCAGIKLFKLSDYKVQFTVYFAYMNLQISFAFLMATYFSNVRTASVTAYLFTIGSGYLGEYLFRPIFEDMSLSRGWTTMMEFFPPFALYRIIYEFSPPPTPFYHTDFSGIHWGDLSDSKNGMKDILIIMAVEWATFLLLTFFLDEFGTLRNGIRKAVSVCRPNVDESSQASQKQTIQLQEFEYSVEMDRTDVLREREIVEQLLQESDISYSIICDNLKKVYHGKDGNAEKIAVTGLSLSMQRGQCFGILGPNGAGKTSLISMLTGFTKPTSGTAYINGMDIRLDMDKIYTGIGVCPQFDLLWETLTGREHLLFYGRLKNLRCAALDRAVEQSLKSVRLFDGGVADKRVAEYSGGMKRRLSVAISLIGDPKVVYMDEPSSGLDPTSRRALWNAVLSAKQNKAIILTTHSMEEAEALCDRIGIMVNGSLQCIGTSSELKAKYGGTYVLTVTTVAGEEEMVEQLVRSVCPAANRVYHISGTQKFEMPKQGLKISQVFQAMQHAKSWLNISAWGLSDATLEDAFIKVASESDISSV
ncbi:unnamed protein product [Urochloa decumbens]|uniref:ABC transporter domain-containing protein n=1 Tax=Urochloa decumbens TaxID=240449 RepID=A0ABC9EMJ2_9POAL